MTTNMLAIAFLLALGACAPYSASTYAPVTTQAPGEMKVSIQRGAAHVGAATDPQLAPPSYDTCYSKTFDMTAGANEDERWFDVTGGQVCPGQLIRGGGRSLRVVPVVPADVQPVKVP